MSREEHIMIQRVSRVLGVSELQVMKTPFVELIEKLVGAYVDLQIENTKIEKEKIKSDITIKAIESFIEETRK